MLNSNKKYQDLKGRSVSCIVSEHHGVLIVTAIKPRYNMWARRPAMKRAEKVHPGESHIWYHFASKSSMKRFLKTEYSAVGAYACCINWEK